MTMLAVSSPPSAFRPLGLRSEKPLEIALGRLEGMVKQEPDDVGARHIEARGANGVCAFLHALNQIRRQPE